MNEYWRPWRIGKSSYLINIVLLSFFLASAATAQEHYSDFYEYYGSKIKRGPVPGRIIVSVAQSRTQADYFSMRNGDVIINGNAAASTSLKNAGAKSVYKAFHINNNATFVLTIVEAAPEKDIIRYLESDVPPGFVQP